MGIFNYNNIRLEYKRFNTNFLLGLSKKLIMKLDKFISFTASEMLEHTRHFGPKVCVCPINGTRRWFTLEHAGTNYEDIESGYLDTVAKAYVQFFSLFYDHGIETLLIPSFGPDLLERGEEYLRMAVQGFEMVTKHELFLAFYKEFDVQVRFYGNFEQYFDQTEFQYLIEDFERIAQETAKHKSHRLFWGLFANDATEAVGKIAIEHFKKYNRAPNREEIVTAYYGTFVEPVDLFLGFDKFSAFDMPLLALGNEDLYYTVSPTLYLTKEQLRRILYDHIYGRKEMDDYPDMSAEEWDHMRAFYENNRGNTQGIGGRKGNIWYPLSQVQIPEAESISSSDAQRRGWS
jgi:tuberculosinol/isotuberculosinol synthase